MSISGSFITHLKNKEFQESVRQPSTYSLIRAHSAAASHLNNKALEKYNKEKKKLHAKAQKEAERRLKEEKKARKAYERAEKLRHLSELKEARQMQKIELKRQREESKQQKKAEQEAKREARREAKLMKDGAEVENKPSKRKRGKKEKLYNDDDDNDSGKSRRKRKKTDDGDDGGDDENKTENVDDRGDDVENNLAEIANTSSVSTTPSTHHRNESGNEMSMSFTATPEMYLNISMVETNPDLWEKLDIYFHKSKSNRRTSK